MDIETRISDGTVTARIGESRIHGGNAASLQEAILRLGESAGGNVIIDMSGVGFVDSSGLGVLVFLDRALAKRNVALYFCGLTEDVQRIFRLARFDELLKTFPSAEEARAAIAANAA